MFWPDFWKGRPEIWQVLGLVGNDPWTEALSSGAPDVRQTESGEIVMDRVRHWKVLEYLQFLSTHAQVVYTLQNTVGEKDLYAPAFALAGQGENFYQVPFAPAIPSIDRQAGVGVGVRDEGGGVKARKSGEAMTSSEPRFLFAGMVQMHPDDGSPFFHHRTADSKLPATHPATFSSGPLTHVSPPASQSQAGKMTAWRGWVPGWLYYTFWRREWGLYSREVVHVVCQRNAPLELASMYINESSTTTTTLRVCEECSYTLSDLSSVDDVCGGREGKRRTMGEKETSPLPITMVRIDPQSPLSMMTSAGLEAHALYFSTT